MEEDIPFKPGDIGSQPESSAEMDMETPNGANHTSCPHALSHAHQRRLLPQPAQRNVLADTLDQPMPTTLTMENLPIRLPRTSLPFKPKSSTTDQLKPLSASMPISTNTLLESTSTRLDNIWEDMPSRSLDGELMKVPIKITGSLPTLGQTNGE